jgi:hypothetical protein
MKQKHDSRAAYSYLSQAAAVMIAGTGLFTCDVAQSEELAATPGMSELERAYWVCDYTASTRRVDMTTGIACVAISDELKARKFGGDFDALLAWWRLHKDTKFRELEAAGRNNMAWHPQTAVEAVSP